MSLSLSPCLPHPYLSPSSLPSPPLPCSSTGPPLLLCRCRTEHLPSLPLLPCHAAGMRTRCCVKERWQGAALRCAEQRRGGGEQKPAARSAPWSRAAAAGRAAAWRGASQSSAVVAGSSGRPRAALSAAAAGSSHGLCNSAAPHIINQPARCSAECRTRFLVQRFRQKWFKDSTRLFSFCI